MEFLISYFVNLVLLLAFIYFAYAAIISRRKIFNSVVNNFANKKFEAHYSKEEIEKIISADPIFIQLVSQNKLSLHSTKDEIDEAIRNYRNENNKNELEKELLKLSNEPGETKKIPFDKAMFLLRHYNKRTVITEDGFVKHKDFDFQPDDINFYVTNEQADAPLQDRNISKEILLPENEVLSVIKREKDFYIVNQGTDDETILKNNRIVSNKTFDTIKESTAKKITEQMSKEEEAEIEKSSVENLKDESVSLTKKTPPKNEEEKIIDAEIIEPSTKKVPQENDSKVDATQTKNQTQPEQKNLEDENKNDAPGLISHEDALDLSYMAVSTDKIRLEKENRRLEEIRFKVQKPRASPDKIRLIAA